MVSVVLPVSYGAGSEAVLKVQFPHRESDAEARALELWDGRGAVRLLAHDAEHKVLLVERCVPGKPLSEEAFSPAIDVICDLLPRLWLPDPQGVNTVADEAGYWTQSLRELVATQTLDMPLELVERALHLIPLLIDSSDDPVLVHQDLHGENILSSSREPWLVIDPKPLSAEPAFGLAPVISAWEFGHGREQVRQRVEILTQRLRIDLDRAIAWAFVRTVAWAQEGAVASRRHVDTARWLHEML